VNEPGLRGESGSEFYLPELGPSGDPDLPPACDLYASGRDAMRSLLAFGVSELGWQVLWVPTYFCQTVVRDIRTEGLEIRSYPDSPLDDPGQPIIIEDERAGAILLLNPFGLRTRSRPVSSTCCRLWVVEDHTHDPWSPSVANSQADYVLASLRKTVPIPDGGFLWSPKGLRLPPLPEPTQQRSAASLLKLAGMALMRLYLEGSIDDKDKARSLLLAGEEGIARGQISGMPSHTRALLEAFPAHEWRNRKRQNFNRLSAHLGGNPSLAILRPTAEQAVPFSLVLQTLSHPAREELRNYLIGMRVYPAVLWSLDNPQVSGIRAEDLTLSRQMLSIHCDGRYDLSDMDAIARIIHFRLGQSQEPG